MLSPLAALDHWVDVALRKDAAGLDARDDLDVAACIPDAVSDEELPLFDRRRSQRT
jgi:hypothetical protein